MNRNVQLALVAAFAVGIGTLAAWFFLGDGLESLVSPPSPTAQVATGPAGPVVHPAVPTVSSARPAPSQRPVPDLEKGLVTLDQTANAGRVTAAAVVQTIVWAIVNQEDDALAACIALDPTAREKAATYLARLPLNARNAYRTPEQLAAVNSIQELLRGAAFRVAGISDNDGGATVALRISDGRTEHDGSLLVQRTPGGWTLPVSGQQMDELLRRTVRFVPE